MTNERIKQLRNKGAGEYAAAYKGLLAECLDEIVALKLQVKDANKAIKLAMKGRK